VTRKLIIRPIATVVAFVLLTGVSAFAAHSLVRRDAGASHHASAKARHGPRARSQKRHRRRKHHHRKTKAKVFDGPLVQTLTASGALTYPFASSESIALASPSTPGGSSKLGGAEEPGSSPPPPQTGGTPKGCFANPESCGYPGTQDVGVANCSVLKASGGKTITKAETIEGLDITGEVVVDASGVKLNDDCVEVNGEEEAESAAVILDNGASNFTISNSTIRGGNTTTESIEEALRNNYSNPGATAIKDRIEDCSECLHQTWTINESYVNANGEEQADESGRSHAEDWWFDGGTVSANDDTLLNPSKQTAVIFAEGGGGSCQNDETVTNSLLAGGGYMFYFCAHSTSVGSSGIDIKDNRFARMACAKQEIENYEERGGFGCGPEVPEGSYFSYGEGSGGYFPRGGFFGIVYEGEGIYDNGAGWEGNYWDNNLQAVEKP
jgi:hypothetical protein